RRYEGGGRVGLERTFAGARRVRVLAIHEQGEPRLALERLSVGGAAAPLEGGPTYRSEHGWSFRATATTPATEPFAVRAATSGAEVLVVPVYGRLRVEAVIAPCDDDPPFPWTEERAVRAGQPACARARLVADGAETLVPGRSFDFELSLCADPGCASPTPMQPGADGTFQAVLGDLPLGRHERTFRAHGGALAFPVDARRATAAVAFGVQRVVRVDAGEGSITTLDAGTFPREAPLRVTLRFHGAYPAEARAAVRCELSGAAAECFRCAPSEAEVSLQDATQVQLSLDATPFCAAASEHGDLPLDARLVLEPLGAAASALSAFTLPIEGDLRYGALGAIELTLEGGGDAEFEARVPAPRTLEEVHARVELDGADLEVVATVGRVRAREDGTAPVRLRATSGECCAARTYDATLVLGTGESELRLPLKIHVTDPGFWVCPGRLILRIAAGVLAFLFLVWLIRGFLGPARFREGATLLFAESHDHLLALREGDDGLRPLARFVETKRGFRRNAALHLGGARAPLPSLKRLPDAGRIEATGGGGATLIVTAGGVERFTEANGWEELAPGTYPVSSRIQLRRGEELYLELRH
ncbi:MAG: hypothetical protein KF901_24485, partial [Myxococcales bacterium]|nr:hypothetical protein [Myxococcales bacterium]